MIYVQNCNDSVLFIGADLNMRDYSGKKPRTYNTIASTVSMDTQKSKYTFEGILTNTDSVRERPKSFSEYQQGHGSLSRSRSHGLDRAKRAGSKRFERIKKSLTFNAHDRVRAVRSQSKSVEVLYEEDSVSDCGSSEA